MSDLKNDLYETDFRKWFKFSQSANNKNMANRLKQMLISREPQKGFDLKIENESGEPIIIISEKFNPLELKLTEQACIEFLEYIRSFFPADEIIEEIPQNQTNIELLGIKRLNQNPDQNNQLDFDQKKSNSFVQKILSKMSSKSPVSHSFHFSLISFVFLQPIILPGNIGYSSPGTWGFVVFWVIMLIISYFSVVAFSRITANKQSSLQILKLNVIHNAFFFLMAMSEVSLIDLYTGKFGLLFYFILVLIGQLAGFLLALLNSPIIYFARGGKLIEFEQKD